MLYDLQTSVKYLFTYIAGVNGPVVIFEISCFPKAMKSAVIL